MRILFLANELSGGNAVGGIGAYVSTLAQALDESGHTVTIITRRCADESPFERLHGIRILRVPIGSLHWYFAKIPGLGSSHLSLPLRELEWSHAFRQVTRDFLSHEPVDVIETIGLGDYWMAFETGLPPIVFRIHGLAYDFLRATRPRVPVGGTMNLKMQTRVASKALAITAPSQAVLDDFRSHFSQAPPLFAIPNPVSPLILQAAQEQLHSKSMPPATRQTILYAGRIEEKKGILPLLNAVSRVVEHDDDVEFVLAGNRHNSISDKVLNRFLRDEEIRGHLRLVGHVPWSELPQLYGRASLFVMPSLYESFGISVLEAMAFGLPVVATKVGGLPEVVEDGVTGILVPPGDSKALADAIKRLLADPDLRRSMGEAGRERVLAKFTVDRVLTQTLSVYDAILRN